MIVKEFYKTREDGVNLYRSYSDIGVMIKKAGTDELYEESIDVESSKATYDETAYPTESMETTSGIDFGAYLRGEVKVMNDPTITVLRASAFRSASMIEAMSLPALVEILGQSVFRDCFALVSLYLPELTGSTGAYMCAGCEVLEHVHMPNVAKLGAYAFNRCAELSRLDVGDIDTIGAGCFADSNLDTLIIRRKAYTPTKIENINAFKGTPIESGDGYVYVPRKLVNAYREADGWSRMPAKIRAIEEYPTVTGGES